VNLMYRIPYLRRIIAKRDQVVAERDCLLQHAPHLSAIHSAGKICFNSIDEFPWRHPFLSAGNISRFRRYSDAVLAFAVSRHQGISPQISCAFSVNMAQNMYKWGRLARKYGAHAELFLHPQDETALSDPCWEEFDGEFADLLNGKGFKAAYPDIRPSIPCHTIPMDDEGLLGNFNLFTSGNRKLLLRQLAQSPGLRHEPLLAYQGVYPYYAFARRLSAFDVIYSASHPIAAYLSGKPYCYFAVGGDIQWDCGRGDSYGEIMLLGVNAARFLMVSNPHALGHSRRLGLTNGVYLPYPMDSERYSPGQGRFRSEWEARFGGSVYVLTTSRLDSEEKGYGDTFFQAVVKIARLRPGVRCIFLAWGNHAEEFKQRIADSGLGQQLIVMMPTGKRRLIEYYRSCDIVLDQLVYGYFGATALEAAAIGKPVVMKQRKEHYGPLYDGDVAPISNVNNPAELEQALLTLIDNPERCRELGVAMRAWLVRNHGEETMTPRLLAMLRLTADRSVLPPEIARMNPLLDDETEEEREYHHTCLREVVHD
jgi:glycosyltransferase involved in cell wall biosynthesis